MPQPDISIALSGGGQIPDGTPNPVVFPDVPLGETGTLVFSVRNLGQEPLRISNITVPAGISLDPNTVSQISGNSQIVLSLGQVVNIPVRLTGTTIGAFGGNFVLQSNDPDNAAYNFPLSGTVFDPNPTSSDPLGEPSRPLDLNELIGLVTAIGTPAPGTVDNAIADGPGSTQIEGSPLNDLITASRGNDLVFGREGNDYLLGGRDNDTLRGETGNDSLSGDLGNDVLFAGPGEDLVIGRSGADILNGNQGNDTLGGGEGSDLIFGGQGNDILAGGVGGDVLFGDRGDDTLVGGVDADQYAIIPEAGSDVIFDYEDGIDKFLLVGGLTLEALQVVDSPAGATFRQGETVLATVLGRAAVQVDPSDFIILPPPPPA